MLQMNLPRHYLDAQGLSLFASAMPSPNSAAFDVNLLILPADGVSDDGRLVRHVSVLVTRNDRTLRPRSLRLSARQLSPTPGPEFEIPAEPQSARLLGRPVTRFGTEIGLTPGVYHFDVAVGERASAQFLTEVA